MILIQYKLSFAHLSLGFAMFLWEDETIFKRNSRYFSWNVIFFSMIVKYFDKRI